MVLGPRLLQLPATATAAVDALIDIFVPMATVLTLMIDLVQLGFAKQFSKMLNVRPSHSDAVEIRMRMPYEYWNLRCRRHKLSYNQDQLDLLLIP
ncbi:hypothetical protein BOX15_Mlig021691g1 [Macrostomum lignano]|uniref:Uncharacterized protein n=1 Tax=Macrostomum lignano TaxID=282301 RepID=A0A267F6E7_9PLAT|nr:hypothetical protein BOX15_Mlig021691g1 [Macrostomum lignano]